MLDCVCCSADRARSISAVTFSFTSDFPWRQAFSSQRFSLRVGLNDTNYTCSDGSGNGRAACSYMLERYRSEKSGSTVHCDVSFIRLNEFIVLLCGRELTSAGHWGRTTLQRIHSSFDMNIHKLVNPCRFVAVKLISLTSVEINSEGKSSSHLPLSLAGTKHLSLSMPADACCVMLWPGSRRRAVWWTFLICDKLVDWELRSMFCISAANHCKRHGEHKAGAMIPYLCSFKCKG